MYIFNRIIYVFDQNWNGESIVFYLIIPFCQLVNNETVFFSKGFKNVYHKEEFGKNKKFYDDSDHKSYYGHHDGFDSFFKAHKGGAFKGGKFKVLIKEI